MQKAILRLTSVTYAIRAQRLMEQRGIQAIVRKSTRSLHVRGCGYGIEVSLAYVDIALEILNKFGIRVLEVSYH